MPDRIPKALKRSRRALWHARVSFSQLVAPSGMQLASAPSGGTSQPPSSVMAVKKEAAALWEAGDRQKAVELLRSRAVQVGGEPLWWTLFGRLQAMGAYAGASIAVRNAAQLDPGNLDALEMLIEDAAIRGPVDVVKSALDRLPAVLVTSPRKHRRALFFALPHNHRPSIDVLRDSNDPVVQEVMRLLDAWERNLLSPAPREGGSLALAIFAMCVGKHRLAREVLRALPDDSVPLDGMRITVRRLVRTGKPDVANKYLQIMADHMPNDQWVRDKLHETDERILTPYQLSQKGYPFPPRRSAPKFEVRRDTSLYLLHNSLPYHSAGYATRTHGLLTALRDLGWNIRGVTRLGYPYDMPKYEQHGDIAAVDIVDGVPYHRLSTTNGIEVKRPIQVYTDRYSSALEEIVLHERPFVLHAASNHWNGLAAVQTANRFGIHSIYEVRGLWEVTRGSRDPEWAKGGMYSFMAAMEADAAKNASQVIAITQALKDELVQRGVEADKITVVPNGVNADRFHPRPKNHELAAHVGVTGKTVIGYIGSVLDYEGLGLLVDAADILASERQDFVVMVVGDGAEFQAFQEDVARRNLEHVITFTGRVAHELVEDYYSLVDIAPFPRLPLPVCEMVSPLKPFEAMAMEKSVVASNVAALAEIVQHGHTGLLHQKGDAVDLTRQLRRLLDDPALRDALAKNGREWVVRERQWTQLAKTVSNIYEGINQST